MNEDTYNCDWCERAFPDYLLGVPEIGLVKYGPEKPHQNWACADCKEELDAEIEAETERLREALNVDAIMAIYNDIARSSVRAERVEPINQQGVGRGN